MATIFILILFPAFSAVLLTLIKSNMLRKWIVRFTVMIIALVVVYLSWEYFHSINRYYVENAGILKYFFMISEVLIAAIILAYGIKYKKFFIILMSIIQTSGILWFEIAGNALELQIKGHMYVDKLSVIMALIIGIIGGLICLFAVPYMEEYHEHHKEYKDRRRMFFPLLFVFLSAMFGIVFSNDFSWMFLFWEITTFCSFLFIGYTKTKEATKNAFSALTTNMIGGLCFTGAMIYLGMYKGITELDQLLKYGLNDPGILIPLFLFAIAALTKSAQLPFSKWLLGAMVAPTPTSALLHSSTMVKAGVYLIIRLAPLFAGNIVGVIVAVIGGLTFLLASFMAISQSDAKRILAFSTIANLGLIVACGGIGTYEALWAGVFLIIFHAVAKSLLFLSVGTAENILGSRDIEDMHGLIVKLPLVAFFMAIGIAGMFLAPFGMLISKWAALRAFIDSKNILIVLFLVFGSAATLFYWTKWLGKLTAVLYKFEKLKCVIKLDAKISLLVHAVLTISLCMFFPVISKFLIEPYLMDVFNQSDITIIGKNNQVIMVIMMCMVALVPFAMRVLTSGDERITTSYMGGVNVGDNRMFIDSMGQEKRMFLTNWYMKSYFGEKRLLIPGIIIGAGVIILGFALVLGSVL